MNARILARLQQDYSRFEFKAEESKEFKNETISIDWSLHNLPIDEENMIAQFVGKFNVNIILQSEFWIIFNSLLKQLHIDRNDLNGYDTSIETNKDGKARHNVTLLINPGLFSHLDESTLESEPAGSPDATESLSSDSDSDDNVCPCVLM